MTAPKQTVVGFTGSRYGSAGLQLDAVETVLKKLRPTVFHHGMCIGWDFAAHHLVRRMFGTRCWIVGHPPIDHRALGEPFDCDELWEAKEYKERDRDIVASVQTLVAAPRDEERRLPRSGTWYTVRRAREKGIRIFTCWPNGAIDDSTR